MTLMDGSYHSIQGCNFLFKSTFFYIESKDDIIIFYIYDKNSERWHQLPYFLGVANLVQAGANKYLYNQEIRSIQIPEDKKYYNERGSFSLLIITRDIIKTFYPQSNVIERVRKYKEYVKENFDNAHNLGDVIDLIIDLKNKIDKDLRSERFDL